jgi:type I restriction enzyme S subunit
MRITNLKRHRITPDLSDRQHVALPASEKEGLRTGLRQGDILISITADIGIIGYVDESVPTPAYINQHVACLRLPPDQVSPKFVAYYLASADPQRRFIEMTDVGAKTGINLTTVGKLTFPCPPLREQEAIAEALSDADALIEGLERLIAKKRLIKQGAMQDLLTAKRRLPGFSGEWREMPFETAFRRINAKASQVQASEYARDGDIPIVDQGKVLVAGYTNVEARRFTPPDGGLVIFGDHTRIVKFVDFDFALGADGTQPITASDGFHMQFLFFSLLSKDIPNTGYNRHFKFLQEITFTVPNEIDEQKAIAAVLHDMDAEIQALETRLEKARQVKEGMMQNLLTGRIRLV